MIGDICLQSIFSNEDGLYSIHLDSGVVVFKTMTLEQMKSVERVLQNFQSLKEDIEQEIWNKCVVKHTYLDQRSMPAGVISTLAETVARLSSPSSIDEIMEDVQIGRGTLIDAREQAVLFICRAFPAYKPEDVESLEWQKIVKRIAQAEMVLQMPFELTKKEVEEDSLMKEVDGVKYYDIERAQKELREVE